MTTRDRALILVVDDSAFVRKKCSRWLVKSGYQVVEAADGIEALDKYERQRPDGVLLDISMPRMDGIDTLHTIMRIDSTARIGMVTALGNRHMAMTVLKEGAKDFIVKPFNKGRLLDTVQKLIKNANLEPSWD